MTTPRNPDPRRGTGSIPRPRGTGPLDAFEVMSKAPPLPGDNQVVRRDALAEAIHDAEALLGMLRPRFGSLGRALDARHTVPEALDALFQGVSSGERTFTLQLSALFGKNPDAERKARIARQQHDHAEKELANAREVLASLQSLQLEQRVVPGFSLSKFRGSIYPLHNLAITFAGIAMLERLFPPPQAKAQPQTQPLTPQEVQAVEREGSPSEENAAAILTKRASAWIRGIYGAIKPQ